MSIDVKMINGTKPVLYVVTLKNKDGMEVALLNYGASIKKITPPNTGKDSCNNVVLGFDNPLDYLTERNYLGAMVGRVAGRLPGHVWRIGDKEFYLEANDTGRHKHGGTHGLDRCYFKLGSIDSSSVCFEYVDGAGSNGYPGNLRISVRYSLKSDSSLLCCITAKTDYPTLFNPTNHTYFALDGPSLSILQDSVSVDADVYQPTSSEGVPQDGWHDVSNTAFDLRTPRVLRDIVEDRDPQIVQAHGLNHAFLLNHTINRPSVRLASPRTHVKLDMYTDAPAVILYSGSHFPASKLTQKFSQYGGLTMEAQVAPEEDSDWSDITLFPGERFERNIEWKFK